MNRTSQMFPIGLAPIVAAFALLVCVSDALAGSLLIDQLPNAGGSLSYDGNAGSPLIGTNIVFETITGDDTPLNDGATLTLIDGRLNFQTGPNLIEPPGIYAWDGGGFFTLTADAVLDSLSNNIIVPANDTIILSGVFVADPLYGAVGFVAGNQILISGVGIDAKHPDVLAYYGLTATDYTFAASQISATNLVRNLLTQAFTASVAEADIVNTAVPEPSTFVLGAIAALGVLGLRRGLSRR